MVCLPNFYMGTYTPIGSEQKWDGFCTGYSATHLSPHLMLETASAGLAQPHSQEAMQTPDILKGSFE